MNTWEDALDRLDVAWCEGRGCIQGGADQHAAGFVSYNPPTVHLTPEPDEADREAFHAALRRIGEASAWTVWPTMDARERAIVAFEFATDEMRHHKLSVPKAITEGRPEGDVDVALFVVDGASQKEAPGTKET